MILGFSWGGWTTANATRTISDKAVLASHAAICVAQFMKDTKHEENFKEFDNLNKWKKSDYIKNGSWDKMPGQEEAGYNVARECADQLALRSEGTG
jgi:hypothetical protein